MKKIYKLVMTLLLCGILLSGLPIMPVQAANKELTVDTAKSMALSQSSEYKGLKNKLALALSDYAGAVQSIREKEKNQRTFRWSPLLNFKFPEKPDLVEQLEYTYKPMELQSQIDVLNHSITDCVYGIYEDVAICFTKVYVLQEKIVFNKERIESCETALEKNKIRLREGLATPTDIETLEKELETLKDTLAADMRSFEAYKEKLGDHIGIDVSTSYTFKNPFVSASLNRDIEEQLINYTLDHDDVFYQAKVATANGLLQLNTNYKLMESQYGSKLRMIDSFVNQAKRGEKMDAAEFKLQYNKLLTSVDQPWTGTKRILFIKIPKEWFKGAIDGVRYVEDEPYALYESAVEYQGLYEEEQAVKKDLINSVEDFYNNYVSTQNTIQSLERENEKKKNDLEEAALLNRTGSLTFEEYTEVKKEYEGLQLDLLEAKSAHTEIMYSFDRVTCGALSAYFKGNSLDMSSAEGGQSYVVETSGEGIYYYLHAMVENNIFEIGLSVPEDYSISVTDFELWVDGVQVGERTGVQNTIRHLALDINEVEKVFIRLYDGDDFIDDCEIDHEVYSDKLIIKSYHVETTESDYLGTYTVMRHPTMGTIELALALDAGQMATHFNIKTEDGKYLLNSNKISVKDKFIYLAAAENSLEELTICLYDESGALLCEATLRSSDQTLRKKQ